MSEHDSVEALARLLARMNETGVPFNAALLGSSGGDVASLALVDNGVGWEACCESDGNYDLWYERRLVVADLSLDEAAERMVGIYATAKARRIAARRN